jgi:hypothetical protein
MKTHKELKIPQNKKALDDSSAFLFDIQDVTT